MIANGPADLPRVAELGIDYRVAFFTRMVSIGSSHAVNAALDPKLPYAPAAGFSAISIVATSPVVITVCLLFWGVVLGPSGALLAVPMTIIAAAVADAFPASRPIGRLLGGGPRDAGAGEAAPSG